jgi:ABC-type uncharacterized transport system substrate-binding protein
MRYLRAGLSPLTRSTLNAAARLRCRVGVFLSPWGCGRDVLSVWRARRPHGCWLTAGPPGFILALAVCFSLTSCTVALVVVKHAPAPSRPIPRATVNPSEPKTVETTPPRKPVSSAEARIEQLTPVEALPTVAILVSKNIPAYSRVADELAKRLQQRHEIYRLNGDSAKNKQVIDRIQQSEQAQVVAIGLLAAQAAQTLFGKQVIFCQVFNYRDHHLATPWMKGVSILPRLSKQFHIWKTLDPGLHSVAVITGPDLEQLVGEARVAADTYGIKLVHKVVSSDKELLYAYKRLMSQLQGLWLLPDNRVLSGQTIRALMAYSVREGKEVLVFTPALLKTGGLLSIEGSESAVAEQVLTRLQQAYGRDSVPGPDVVPLTEVQLRINAPMAKHLGLTIPLQYRRYAHEP